MIAPDRALSEAGKLSGAPGVRFGAIHQLANKIGFIEALNTRLQILPRRRPYRDADHVLDIAYNVMCGGHVLDDIEQRRNAAAFLDALGAGDASEGGARHSVIRIAFALASAIKQLWDSN